MTGTISMQDMRHLNLFRNITKISTTLCFEYNDTIYFCVPKHLISKAIGENGKNSKELNKILGKKIKIVFAPNALDDAEEFIRAIVSPISFKNIEMNGNEIIVTAGTVQNKAMLLGREKRRLLEMQNIIRNFFGKELRII